MFHTKKRNRGTETHQEFKKKNTFTYPPIRFAHIKWILLCWKEIVNFSSFLEKADFGFDRIEHLAMMAIRVFMYAIGKAAHNFLKYEPKKNL